MVSNVATQSWCPIVALHICKPTWEQALDKCRDVVWTQTHVEVAREESEGCRGHLVKITLEGAWNGAPVVAGGHAEGNTWECVHGTPDIVGALVGSARFVSS